ncbi:MAG: MBL fold metallo-hydrolase [Halodesulfurarchaeum sp.]
MPIHSDWGDWLPTAIAEAEPDGLDLWYLGCNGIALKAADGTTVFIDPYLGTGDPPRTIRMIPVPFHPADVREADAVLATHEHTDHVHGPSQGPILEGTGATFVGPPASVEKALETEGWTDTFEVATDQFESVDPGDAIEVGSLTVHVEPAQDPDAMDPVSYVIEGPDSTFFHGGDTKPSPAFERVGEEYDIDLGVLAFGSVGMMPQKDGGDPQRTRWYNDENQIIEAAAALGLDRLLPTHWDMWKRMTADPTALFHHARGFEHPRHIEVLEIGDRLRV